MANLTLHTTKEGKLVEWDNTDHLFTIDGVKVTPDFLVNMVNGDGRKAVRFTRKGDECHVAAFDLKSAEHAPQDNPPA